MSTMTVEELTAILRANPVAAIEAVKAAKIAGPRTGRGGDCTGRRPAHGGQSVAGVDGSFRGGWYTYAPNLREPQYTGAQINSAKGETLEAFTARADELWRSAGWILVDEASR